MALKVSEFNSTKLNNGNYFAMTVHDKNYNASNTLGTYKVSGMIHHQDSQMYTFTIEVHAKLVNTNQVINYTTNFIAHSITLINEEMGVYDVNWGQATLYTKAQPNTVL